MCSGREIPRATERKGEKDNSTTEVPPPPLVTSVLFPSSQDGNEIIRHVLRLDNTGFFPCSSYFALPADKRVPENVGKASSPVGEDYAMADRIEVTEASLSTEVNKVKANPSRRRELCLLQGRRMAAYDARNCTVKSEVGGSKRRMKLYHITRNGSESESS